MEFTPALIETHLIKRYKRFLADVELPDGNVITVHCPNSGSMRGLTAPQNRVWISDSQNPKRKLRHTLEMVEVDGIMVGVNTNAPNKLAVEAIQADFIPELSGYDSLRREVKYGTNSRIDILLESNGKPDLYVEVKNVHFQRVSGIHEFPDSITSRGAKHLDEMAREVAKGNRAAMLYVIQRKDGDRFQFADDLDPAYVEAFRRAIQQGVEAYAFTCTITPERIEVYKLISVTQPLMTEVQS